MRVLMVATYPTAIGAPRGGVEAATYHLCEGLGQRGDVDLHVLSFENRESVSHEGLQTYQVVRHPSGPLPFRQTRLRRVVKRYQDLLRPDLTHVQGRATMLPIMGPSVLTIHGVMETAAGWDYSGLSLQAFRLIEVRAEKRRRDRALNIISISPFVDEILPRVKGRRLWRIPNPVNVPVGPSPLVSSRVTFVYAGVILERKGLMHLLRALAIASDRLPNATLKIVGELRDPGYAARCRNEARKIGVSNRVCWIGPLTQEDFWRELRGTTALVLPSAVETAPMVISEAFMMGVPVVATSVGGIPEMIGTSGAGIVVSVDDVHELADQLVRISDQRDRVWRMEAAIEQSHRFERTAVAEQTAKVYHEILANG